MAAIDQGQTIVSLPCNTTGLKPYKFVTVDASGYVTYPANAAGAIGILQGGTTGSTNVPVGVPVAIAGISKLAISTASTVGAPDLVMSSSVGSALAMTAAGVVSGKIVRGSSGGANRVVSVLIAGVNGSTATV